MPISLPQSTKGTQRKSQTILTSRTVPLPANRRRRRASTFSTSWFPLRPFLFFLCALCVNALYCRPQAGCSFILPPSSLHFLPSSAFLGAKQRVDHAHALHRVFHAVGQCYFAANRARKRLSLQS